jgi:hypothetical protein
VLQSTLPTTYFQIGLELPSADSHVGRVFREQKLLLTVVAPTGLEPAFEMDGGFAAWKKAGFPVAERPSKKG